MDKILVTGSSSGLGRYLYESLRAEAFIRNETINDKIIIAEELPYDCIIHCGWNLKPNIDSAKGLSYISESVKLTQQLLNIPHKKFVFISTIDVYPKNNNLHEETEEINLNDVQGVYGISKLISEEIVKSSKNYLILRLSALLGKYTRYNTITKIAMGQDIGISKESSFNFITYDHVKDFICYYCSNDINGTYNVVAKNNVTLNSIIKGKNTSIKDGEWVYKTGNLSWVKLNNEIDNLTKTSMANYKSWSKSL